MARGLSPLARGTLLYECKNEKHGRFIPAGAGNTFLELFKVEPFAVYPRWRGEHPFVYLTSPDRRGLSPLARGTRHQTTRRARCERFIPAGAGNTVTPPSLLIKPPVYPRWRGEHRSQ